MLTIIAGVCQTAGWTLSEGTVLVHLPQRRHQLLQLHTYQEDGESLVRVHTAIAPASVLNDARMRAALRLNATMRHGALAVLDGELVLCDTFQTHHSTPEEVRRSMTYLASRADDFERGIMHTDER